MFFFLFVPLFLLFFFFFFFNDTATTEIYTLSLHDALPILRPRGGPSHSPHVARHDSRRRSEEHTSELQSPTNLVCRLLLEKKKKIEPHPLPRDSFLYKDGDRKSTRLK